MHSLIHEQKGIIPCYFNLLLFANMQQVKDSVSSLINSKNIKDGRWILYGLPVVGFWNTSVFLIFWLLAGNPAGTDHWDYCTCTALWVKYNLILEMRTKYQGAKSGEQGRQWVMNVLVWMKKTEFTMSCVPLHSGIHHKAVCFQWELRPWCWWTNSCLFGWWPETQLFSQVTILRILIWYVLCSSRCLVFAQNWIGKIAGYSGTTCRWFLMWLNVNQMVFTLQCHKSVSSHLIQLI